MTANGRPRRLLIGAAAACLAVAGAIVSDGAAGPTVSAAPSDLGAGGEYHALTPARILDTRGAGINTPPGRKPTSPQGNSFEIAVLGKGGIPADPNQVLAAVVNVTVASPDLGGYLSIKPTGGPAGQSSLVNYEAGQTVPNLAVLGVGTNGTATITLTSPDGAGGADVLVDVFGWISTSTYTDGADTGSRLIPVGPGRLLDTRSAPTPAGWAGGRAVGAGEQLKLQIRGADATNPSVADIVPDDDDVTGVMVNLTAVNAGGQGTFVSATPTPTPAGVMPATSVTNLRPNQVKANTAIVPVGPDGAIHLYNSAGATHLIVDVLGYLVKREPDTTTTGRIVPLSSPFRALDTRQAAFAAAPLGHGTVEDWSFESFADSVKLGTETLGAQSALIGNLTATGLQRTYPTVPVGTYLTVYPGGVGMPVSSNVNVSEGESVPNMSLIKYGTDNVVKVYNDAGSIHYILDVYAVVLS